METEKSWLLRPVVDPVDALARLQLAKAFALSGNTVRARSVYDECGHRYVTVDRVSTSSQPSSMRRS